MYVSLYGRSELEKVGRVVSVVCVFTSLKSPKSRSTVDEVVYF